MSGRGPKFLLQVYNVLKFIAHAANLIFSRASSLSSSYYAFQWLKVHLLVLKMVKICQYLVQILQNLKVERMFGSLHTLKRFR